MEAKAVQSQRVDSSSAVTLAPPPSTAKTSSRLAQNKWTSRSPARRSKRYKVSIHPSKMMTSSSLRRIKMRLPSRNPIANVASRLLPSLLSRKSAALAKAKKAIVKKPPSHIGAVRRRMLLKAIGQPSNPVTVLLGLPV